MNIQPVPHILVADDEEGIRFVLTEVLTSQGYDVTEACDGARAIEILRDRRPDLVILDINMPKVNGMKVLAEARRLHPDIIVLIITAYGSNEIAMNAIQAGAYDYFTKPFDINELRSTIQRALEKKNLLDQIRDLEFQVSGQTEFREIIGSSDAMQEIFRMMRRVIDNTVPVLLMGESGTGKGMIVQAIHSRGPRASAPLVKVNCAAIPETLLESELFGHQKGSFTGATDSRPGRFELAQGGTLFLDEIGEMPLSLQAKILTAVQEGEIQRVGAKSPTPIDVRVVTATNRNLAEEVAQKRFREDLYFRINVIAIELPPLRERLTDIPLLVDYFIRLYNKRLGKNIAGLSPEVLQIFIEYPWPGNIRELENVIQRALIMAGDSLVRPKDLPPNMRAHAQEIKQTPGDAPAALTLEIPMSDQVEAITERAERALIAQALATTTGRQQAAERLGISRKSLHNKMLKYGMMGS